MKTIAIWMAALALSTGSALAASPANESLAAELIALMKVDEALKQGMEMSRKAMLMQTQQMAGQTGAANLEQIKAHQARVMDLIESEMSWEKVMGQFVELYASVFTESELEGLIEFYRSPVGQAFIRKQPELMQKSMELNHRMMMNLQPKIMQMMKDEKAAAAPAP